MADPRRLAKTTRTTSLPPDRSAQFTYASRRRRGAHIIALRVRATQFVGPAECDIADVARFASPAEHGRAVTSDGFRSTAHQYPVVPHYNQRSTDIGEHSPQRRETQQHDQHGLW